MYRYRYVHVHVVLLLQHATRVPGGTGWDAGDIWIENEYKSTTLDYLECPEIALLHQRYMLLLLCMSQGSG